MKILFVHKGMRSFVRKDFELLAKHFNVQDFFYNPARGIVKNLWQQLRLLFWLIKELPGSQVIFIWFAGYHSFLPVLLGKLSGKRIVIAIGGYETTYIPEIHYGVFSNPLRSFMARFSFRNSHLLLPVDRTLIENLKKFVPDLTTPFQELDTGYDAGFWKPVRKKEKMVLTVGTINSETVFIVKGIDLFVQTARLLPEIEFVIVGVEETTRKLIPDIPNIKVFPPASAKRLREFYSQAKVYAQFSISEGFPNVVSEAMLCECIPIVSKVGGMPRQVNNCGFVLKEKDPKKAAAIVRQALNAPNNYGRKCREHIMQHFPVEKREKKLFEIIQQLY